MSLTTAGRVGTIPGTALALLAPLAAALGIAMIYGEENDPALELALASPTSPRLIVLARLVLALEKGRSRAGIRPSRAALQR